MSGCSGDPRPTEFRVGGLAQPGTAADEYWVSFRKALTARQGNELVPTLLTGGQSGSDDQIFAATRRGRLEMAMAGTFSVATAAPEFSLLAAPFLFLSEAEAAYTLASIEPYLSDILLKHGLVLLRAMPMGMMNIYARQPIISPEEIAGFRTRSPIDDASQIYFRALGADLIPLSTADVLPSLQTGLVSGGSTVTLQYVWGGLSEAAPHLTLTGHSFLANFVFANASWWSGLTVEARQAIESSLGTADVFAESMRRSEAQALESLRAGPRTVVHELTQEQRAAWAEPAGRLTPTIVAQLGGSTADLYARITEAQETFRTSGGTSATDAAVPAAPPARP